MAACAGVENGEGGWQSEAILCRSAVLVWQSRLAGMDSGAAGRLEGTPRSTGSHARSAGDRALCQVGPDHGAAKNFPIPEEDIDHPSTWIEQLQRLTGGRLHQARNGRARPVWRLQRASAAS